LFSFGCFCHLSPLAIEDYMRQMHSRLKPGAHGFVMIADYDKYNRALANTHLLSSYRACVGRRLAPVRLLWRVIDRLWRPPLPVRSKDEDMCPRPHRWYHLGVAAACELLERNGYRIVDPDVGVSHRDVVVHFVRV
jgi:hypothetical protein